MTSYVKKTWVEESLAGSACYNINAPGGGSAIYSNVGISLSTPVAVAGTAFDPDAMNNIETGIDDLYNYGMTYGTSSSPVSFSGSAQLLDSHRQLLFLDSSGSAGTVSFPSSGSANHIFTLVNSGSAGAITMNDAGATVINPGETITFIPDESDYRVVGETLYRITDDPAWAAKGDEIIGTANDTAAIMSVGANGEIKVANDSETTGQKWVKRKFAAPFTVGNGIDVVSDGIQPGCLTVPCNCIITRVEALADQSGSIVVDIWKDSYANYPPTDADSITASAPVTIAAADKSYDETLTDWTLTLSEGDKLYYNVDSCTTITWCTITLIGYSTQVS
jgi:hypothetical protein